VIEQWAAVLDHVDAIAADFTVQKTAAIKYEQTSATLMPAPLRTFLRR
jgi:hypothetical protein